MDLLDRPTLARTAAGTLQDTWWHARPVERVAYVVGAALVVSGVAHLGVLLATGGTWLGPVSFRKPLTFGVSFGLTLATVAWVTSFVAVRERTRAVLLGVFTAASVLETALVTMQAWRGVPSHVNFETGIDTTVSMMLAAGGGVIIVCVLGFTAAVLRGSATLAPDMRLALRAGFALLVAGLAIGAVMIASGVVQARTGEQAAAYAVISVLKPVHGVTLHAVLVLPGLAWLLGLAGWNERRRTVAVGAAVLAYVAVAVLTLVAVL